MTEGCSGGTGDARDADSSGAAPEPEHQPRAWDRYLRGGQDGQADRCADALAAILCNSSARRATVRQSGADSSSNSAIHSDAVRAAV